jgi:hypothetical protein
MVDTETKPDGEGGEGGAGEFVDPYSTAYREGDLDIHEPEPDEPTGSGTGGDGDGEKEGAGSGGTDEISSGLVERAKAAGFTDDDIASFNDKASLERTLVIHYRRLANGPGAPKADDTDKPGDGSADGSGKPEGTADESTSGTATPFDFKAELGDYDEELTEGLTKFAKHVEERYKALDAKVDKVLGGVQSQRNAEIAVEIDGIFDDLNEPELFGKGPLSGLTTDSTEAENRAGLVNTAVGIGKGLAEVGKRLPLKDLIDAAMSVLHRERVETRTRGKIAKKANRATRSATIRPSARKAGDNMTNEERAIEAIGEIMHGSGGNE